MATIITRETGEFAKGSALTNEELDNNFININEELLSTLTRSLVPECTNSLGTPIIKGTAVMIVGGTAGNLTIAPTINNGSLPDSNFLGILLEDVAANATDVRVVLYGLVDFDTSSYIENTKLYLSAASGGLTSTKPIFPACYDVFATVVSSSLAGTIFVNRQYAGLDRGIGREYTSITDPTVDDDGSNCYTVWSKIINTATNAIFVCTDNTTGAAVWVAIT